MANINSAALGNFEAVYNQILQKNQVAPKSALILGILKDAIIGKINDLDVVDRLEKDLNLDFDVASNIAYDLKVNILDKKAELSAIKETLQQEGTVAYQPQNIAAEFLSKLNYKISDPALNKRYQDAITSWLKGVRDIPELKEILIRSSKIGGVGMSEEVFYALYDLLIAKQDQAKKDNIDLAALAGQPTKINSVQESNIDVAAKVARPQLYQPASQDVTIDQILAEKAKLRSSQTPTANFAPPLVEEIQKEEEFLESTEELPAPAVVAQPVAPQVAAYQPVAPQPVTPQYIRPPEIRQPVKRPSDQMPSRPQMSDVKFEPKLYGPLDELAAMSLADFRRLSKDPKQSIQRISSKLDILEGESVVRKSDGIQALKSSPLYKIYADIMNRALVEGKTFDQIVAERGDITLAEFQAIMALNKSLKN